MTYKPLSLRRAIKIAAFAGSSLALSQAAFAQNTALNIKTSGFATIAVSASDTDYETDAGITKKASIDPDSVIGLQFDSNISDKTSFTLQLVARGDNSHASDGKSDFEPDVEWAFITLKPADGHRIKAGRLRNPVFMYSETLEVGTTYPWVRPPQDTYQHVLSTELEGLSYEYTHNFDDWDLSINPFIGASHIEEGVEIHKQAGLNFTLQSEYHHLRASYFHSELDLIAASEIYTTIVDGGFFPGDTGADFNDRFTTEQVSSYIDEQFRHAKYELMGLGYRYEDERFLVIAEYNEKKLKSALLSDVQSAYITFGMNFGQIQPHITYSVAKTTDNDERDEFITNTSLSFSSTETEADILSNLGAETGAQVLGILNAQGLCGSSANPLAPAFVVPPGSCSYSPMGALLAYASNQTNERDSITLGVNWKYDDRSSLKFDVQYLSNFEDTPGFFGDERSYGGRDLDDEEVFIYRLALSTTF